MSTAGIESGPSGATKVTPDLASLLPPASRLRRAPLLVQWLTKNARYLGALCAALALAIDMLLIFAEPLRDAAAKFAAKYPYGGADDDDEAPAKPSKRSD